LRLKLYSAYSRLRPWVRLYGDPLTTFSADGWCDGPCVQYMLSILPPNCCSWRCLLWWHFVLHQNFLLACFEITMIRGFIPRLSENWWCHHPISLPFSEPWWWLLHCHPSQISLSASFKIFIMYMMNTWRSLPYSLKRWACILTDFYWLWVNPKIESLTSPRPRIKICSWYIESDFFMYNIIFLRYAVLLPLFEFWVVASS
jgi:hypothetical protein